jgi:hypothetical protein
LEKEGISDGYVSAHPSSPLAHAESIEAFTEDDRLLHERLRNRQSGVLRAHLDSKRKLEELHQIISELTHELKTTVLLDDAQVRFVQASEAISAALATAYNHSLEIARETYILSKSGRSGRSTSLVRRCEEVNGWARLCTIAVFEQSVERATEVLKSQRNTRLTLRPTHPRNGDDQSLCPHEFAIARAVDNIGAQCRLVAKSMVFWLDRPNNTLSSQQRDEQLLMAGN